MEASTQRVVVYQYGVKISGYADYLQTEAFSVTTASFFYSPGAFSVAQPSQKY